MDKNLIITYIQGRVDALEARRMRLDFEGVRDHEELEELYSEQDVLLNQQHALLEVIAFIQGEPSDEFHAYAEMRGLNLNP
jgi:hypothetical protein